MGLRDIESALPPGFRFYPSDEELVCHYLCKKVSNVKVYEGTMMEVDLHACEPWELPEGARLSDNEWYFFSFRDRKYATGSRANRATRSGYWKATGKDRTVYHPKTRGIAGMRKTLVFYGGRAPNGIKTDWVMHEFRLENHHTPPPKEDWVLCRVCHKRRGEVAGGSATSVENLVADDQSMPGGCGSEMVGPSLPHYSFLDFPRDQLDYNGLEMGMGSRGDDYGFLLDVGLDEEDGLFGIGAKGEVDSLLVWK